MDFKRRRDRHTHWEGLPWPSAPDAHRVGTRTKQSGDHGRKRIARGRERQRAPDDETQGKGRRPSCR
eukprot:11856815-Alexandrium_andersonii.AAC.1